MYEAAMRLSKIISFLAVMLLAVSAVAHGSGEHLMGTVKAIDASSITVETTDGHATTAVIDAATKFERSDQPSKREDVVVGEKVVVHSNKVGDSLHALVVKVGVPAKH